VLRIGDVSYAAAWEQSCIHRGAAVNAKDGDGYTPLHIACGGASREMALLLIEHGANIHELNKWQTSPVQINMCSHFVDELMHKVREVPGICCRDG
jgi:hypothetical protein